MVGVETGVFLCGFSEFDALTVLPERICFLGEPLRSDTVGPTLCERTETFSINFWLKKGGRGRGWTYLSRVSLDCFEDS